LGTDAGLLRYRDGQFVTFDQRDGLPDDKVTALYEDREGSLWVGTRAGGLAQFTDRALDRQSGPPSLADRWVSTVVEEGDGTLWAGSGKGLTRFRNGEERTYTRTDGLPSNEVVSIFPTGAGELWV